MIRAALMALVLWSGLPIVPTQGVWSTDSCRLGGGRDQGDSDVAGYVIPLSLVSGSVENNEHDLEMDRGLARSASPPSLQFIAFHRREDGRRADDVGPVVVTVGEFRGRAFVVGKLRNERIERRCWHGTSKPLENSAMESNLGRNAPNILDIQMKRNTGNAVLEGDILLNRRGDLKPRPVLAFIGLSGEPGRLGSGVGRFVAEVNGDANADQPGKAKKEAHESVARHLFSSIRGAPLLAQIGLALVYGAIAYGSIALGGAAEFLPKRPRIKRALIWGGFPMIVVGPLCLIVGASPYS